MADTSFVTSTYYHLKPVIPRRLQLSLRRRLAARKRPAYADLWPVLESAGSPPLGWPGWPEGKKFALVLTHDVEFKEGQDKCFTLAETESALGFRSLFNFVPERYQVSEQLRAWLISNGFEVGVHGLYHDGKLFKSEQMFRERAEKINHYLKQWQAKGFRAPAMHHNLAWILRYLDVEYDLSTFDTDPFEPQSDGVGTIFPFLVADHGVYGQYVEMPYTLPQDHGLFIILQEKNVDIWKRKLDWIAEKGGMALLNTHPDYLYFGKGKLGVEEFPVEHYARFLEWVEATYKDEFWHALPGEVAAFYREQDDTREHQAATK